MYGSQPANMSYYLKFSWQHHAFQLPDILIKSLVTRGALQIGKWIKHNYRTKYLCREICNLASAQTSKIRRGIYPEADFKQPYLLSSSKQFWRLTNISHASYVIVKNITNSGDQDHTGWYDKYLLWFTVTKTDGQWPTAGLESPHSHHQGPADPTAQGPGCWQDALNPHAVLDKEETAGPGAVSTSLKLSPWHNQK